MTERRAPYMTPQAAHLAQLCQDAGLPEPVAEFRFHPTRRWRFDYAWPDQQIAIEVEGGAWVGGRHTRGGGYIADMDKYNQAQVSGWIVLRYTPAQMRAGEWVGDLVQALQCHGKAKK